MSVDRSEVRKLTSDAKRTFSALAFSGLESLPAGSKKSNSNKISLIEPIRKKALGCTACKLCKERNSVVFGEGSLDARLVFVGEAPGRDEDAQGRPFVGQAGKLLTKIIEAMKLRREEVYIANIVKCRPLKNRPPEPDEIESCMPFLEAQLDVIAPKVIVALGRTAVTALLQTEAPMSSLRGRTFDRNGIPLIVTYHPAYLLRNPSAKKEVWEDMKKVLKLLA